ncbi:hypothetical protein KIPB_013049, partial [Kipferlia bialata]
NIVASSTVVSVIILVCCILDVLLLGWEHMIAASKWDWGWLKVLLAECILIAPTSATGSRYRPMNHGRYSKPYYLFWLLVGTGSVKFLVECVVRFYVLWWSLSKQYLYHEAPRSTHMFYGPYLVAAIGSGILCIGWLGWAILAGIMHVFPWGEDNSAATHIREKRTQFFNEHGVAGDQDVQIAGNVMDDHRGDRVDGGLDLERGGCLCIPLCTHVTLPETGINAISANSEE